MIVAACGVAIAVGFSACDKKEPGYSSNETVNFGTYNIVAAEGEAPYVAPVRYQIGRASCRERVSFCV